MNEEVTQTEQEVAMMTVIADIVAGGRGLIRDWPLRANAEQALREGGPDGLARYYQDCIDRPGTRAAWIKATLEAHGKKTLESEYSRIMAVYRSGLGPDGQRRAASVSSCRWRRRESDDGILAARPHRG